MKSYSIHWINIVVIVVALYFLSDITINIIADPNYYVRRVPRALIPCFTVYLFYKCLTTAYKVSFLEDGAIILYSVLRNIKINAGKITGINSYIMFSDVVTDKGTYSVSSLMEGTANIKIVLLPLIKNKPEQAGIIGIGPRTLMDRNKILKFYLIIILVVFAVYIEWQQVEIFLNHLKNP